MSILRSTSILAVLGLALTFGTLVPSPAHAAKPTKGKTQPAASPKPEAPPSDAAPPPRPRPPAPRA